MNKGHKTSGTKPDQHKQSVLKTTAKTDLITFLSESLPDKNRKAIVSLLKHRQISVDHQITTQFNHPLHKGQQVIITWDKVLQGSPHKGLRIVFEDPYLVVIEKPAGLLSIATDKEQDRTAYRILNDQAQKINPRNRVFIVHRLDREASGLMMFAKRKDTQEQLQESWQHNVLERRYVVVVEGLVAQDQGTITSWLKENQARMVYVSPIPDDGQKAVLHYQVLSRHKDRTLLDVTLETGRKNQIRVQCKELGHCVMGDKKYGATQKALHRLGLHARVLAFRHPVSGEALRFETPIPAIFLRLFPEFSDQRSLPMK